MTKFLAAAVGVLLLLAGALTWVLSRNDDPGVGGLQVARVDPFGGDGRIAAGPFAAVFNQDGTRLGVRSANGVGVAEAGKVDRFTEDGVDVLDFAWMPSTVPAVIFAEAPPTSGRLVVVKTDGEQLGVVRLDPVVEVAGGQGLTVSPNGREAVLVGATRGPIAAEPSLDLVHVDLETGATRPLTSTTETDEVQPTFVTQTTVAFLARATAADDDRAEAAVLDLTTGAVTRISPAGEAVSRVGVLGRGELVAYVATMPGERPDRPGPTLVWAVPPDQSRERVRLGDVGGPRVVALDPTGRVAVVSEKAIAGEERSVSQLRAVELDPVAGPT